LLAYGDHIEALPVAAVPTLVRGARGQRLSVPPSPGRPASPTPPCPRPPRRPPPYLQKCKDASFCDRNRGKAGRKFTVDPASVAASGAALSAALISDAPPAPGGGGGAAAGPPRFNLTLLSYGGTVRLLVDEPGAGRYQVRFEREGGRRGAPSGIDFGIEQQAVKGA
jgi:hypothetical protein